MATTRKERAKSAKTLIIMLQSLRDYPITITLRNDTIVHGTILKVDCNMNIELQNATVNDDPFYCTTNTQPSDIMGLDEKLQDDDEEQADLSRAVDTSCRADDEDPKDDLDQMQESPTVTSYDYFVVKGSRIRHIDLPNDLDLVAGAKVELERIRERHKQWTKKDIVRKTDGDK